MVLENIFFVFVQVKIIIKHSFSSITGEMTREERKNIKAFARFARGRMRTLSSASSLIQASSRSPV